MFGARGAERARASGSKPGIFNERSPALSKGAKEEVALEASAFFMRRAVLDFRAALAPAI